jgi:hypothetical protein
MYPRTTSWAMAALLLAVAATESRAQVVRVSVATDGTQANGHSFLAAMSATGRFVAFTSFASNLVAGDTNGVEDVFLRDRDTDADGILDEAGAVSTVRVSQRGAAQAIGGSNEAAITADGHYVVFSSFAANLFTSVQDPLATSVILRWDRLTGDIVLVSQTTDGQMLQTARSVSPDVSDDGNQVVFVHGGSQAAEANQGHRGIVYRRDIAAGTLTQVSTVPLVDAVDRVAFNQSPSISGDGRTIAYAVVQKYRLETTNETVYVTATGAVHVVDTASNTIRSSYAGVNPKLSRNGAFLAFIGDVGLLPLGILVRIHLASGERLNTGSVGVTWEPTSIAPSGRYFAAREELADYHYGSFVFTRANDRMAFDATDTTAAFAESRAGNSPDPVIPVVVADLATLLDRDGDGLNDHWESVFGLSTFLDGGASGTNGATGDPDNDGVTNADEFARGSNPVGVHALFLAEGAAGTFFTTRYSVANAGTTQANVALRLDLDGGGHVLRTVWVPGGSRVAFDSRSLGLGTASFSAAIESSQPIVADRLMTWGDGTVPYGSHAEAASTAPGTNWILAEGSTVLGFQLFYLLQNPQATATTATIRFLLPSGAPIVRTYELPARSRTTVLVNSVPGLESTDVSAEITATQPIAVERAMYRSGGGQVFALGHDASAVAQPAGTWFFAEGATGTFFDTYLLLANPSSQPATVNVEYLRDADGPVTATYTVPANARFTVFVDGVPGVDQAAFGMRVTSAVPIVAERAMYWAGGFFDYYEGHVASGATQPGTRWVLAEGEQLGPYQAQTFVLIANTGDAPVSVSLRSLPEPFRAPSQASLDVAARSRVTVPLSSLAGYDRAGIEVVQQAGPAAALVVEGAIYWSTGTQTFAAGAAWPATRIP